METDLTIKIVGASVATITAIKGLVEYSKSNKTKKIEVLEKLIGEFNGEKFDNAKRLLDDFIISEGKESFFKDDLGYVLRNHKIEPIESEFQVKIRDSFDYLLDFFTKLEYLLLLGLISKNDFFYFRYYLNKILTDNNILRYCEIYEYSAIFRLCYIFNKNTHVKNIENNFYMSIKIWKIRYLHF